MKMGVARKGKAGNSRAQCYLTAALPKPSRISSSEDATQKEDGLFSRSFDCPHAPHRRLETCQLHLPAPPASRLPHRDRGDQATLGHREKSPEVQERRFKCTGQEALEAAAGAGAGNLAEKQRSQQPQVITSYDNQGTQLTVEVHPQDAMPQLLKKFSLAKRLQGDKNGNTRPRQPGGKDAHAYPWDRSSLKSMPLDLRQFEALDTYASQVTVKSGLDELVSDLLQEAHSDLERVRAIWIWICHHIASGQSSLHSAAALLSPGFLVNLTQRDESPRHRVISKKDDHCLGKLQLFEKLLIAGVQCMTVPGYSKGFGYQTGQSFSGEFDHAWNAVHLEGRWHLVDSTWGSGLVDTTTSKFTFLYNEFYFLTHPALFIEDHFPDNKNWQLLKPPQSLRQFENNMYHKSEFYNKGMLSAHPETPMIRTVNGKATVTIESCAPTLFMFMLNGKQEHGLLSLRKDGMKLEVYPPTLGTHKLQIFAKGNSDIYSSVLEYTLKCNYVDMGVRLPAELHQPVGPSWFSEQMGIVKPSHPDPIIHTSDGRCSVSFGVEEGISVLASLHGDDGPVTEETQRRYIFQLHREKRTELKVQLPHAGKFALKIFVKKRQEPGNYIFVFNYLLCCANTKVNWPVFPESFGNWGQDNELLEPLSGVLPANRNIPFKLKLHGVAKALVKGQDTWPLTLNHEGYWEGSCSTAGCQEVYVMVLENANHSFYSYILKYKVNAQ
ncbi:PREDICTED: kyphoscoliosis peptidase [Galeopterus variegatus]|uniref:Kyphoscoliosis peptidase n=1 Tax=Galeopterus variegatus TaxID=482537 RepID=A0ABM0QDK2_GALVR|nr:PREDICTED: kyphoscoliosis peptidase [Galeopterus variegatus]